jgi:hypothetical protein
MLPPNERFDGDHPTLGEIDNRLILEREAITSYRFLKLCPELSG